MFRFSSASQIQAGPFIACLNHSSPVWPSWDQRGLLESSQSSLVIHSGPVWPNDRVIRAFVCTLVWSQPIGHEASRLLTDTRKRERMAPTLDPFDRCFPNLEMARPHLTSLRSQVCGPDATRGSENRAQRRRSLFRRLSFALE